MRTLQHLWRVEGALERVVPTAVRTLLVTAHLQEDLQESAERALRRTDEIISRARDGIPEGRENPRRLLAKAVEMHAAGRPSFWSGGSCQTKRWSCRKVNPTSGKASAAKVR